MHRQLYFYKEHGNVIKQLCSKFVLVFYLAQALYVHIMISMVRVCQRSILVWCLWSWQHSVAGYRTWSMNNKEVGQFGRPLHSSTFTFRRPSHFIDSINWNWTIKPPNKKTEGCLGMLLHFHVVCQPFEGSENVNTSTFFHYICQGHEVEASKGWNLPDFLRISWINLMIFWNHIKGFVCLIVI